MTANLSTPEAGALAAQAKRLDDALDAFEAALARAPGETQALGEPVQALSAAVREARDG